MNNSYKILLGAACLRVISYATPTLPAVSGGGSHLNVASVLSSGAAIERSQSAPNAVVDGAAEQTRCSSPTLLNYIKDSLYFYNGTDNALGISQRISDNVLANQDGPYIVLVTQVIAGTKKTQWAYWGSSTIYSSPNWCLYANADWIVQIAKVDLQ